ncbi:HET-domain-containing protein, partial [Setomelanomma holmii]
YQYTLLNQSKREIRLLILEDLPNSEAPASLRCRVLTSKDRFPTPFYTLSYVWGDPKPVYNIKIDGEATMISQSLGYALLSIKNNTHYRVLWAGALCINQSDNVEKSWQVQQMTYIYARAKAVISWLGSPSEDSHLGLDALQDLTHHLKHTHWKRNWSKDNIKMSSKLLEVALALSCDPARWTAIVALTARPYWSRIWIFQEMASSRENFFLCGNVHTEDLKYPLYFLMLWENRSRGRDLPNIQ